MTNLELVSKALDVWNNRDHWTYVQGGLGELSDSTRIKNLYIYYRRVGKNSMTCDYAEWLPQFGIAKDGKAKQCTDCSNFIQYLLGSGKNAAASHYTNMKDAGDIFVAPVGTLLLIPNAHVGIVTQQGVRDKDGTFKVIPEAMDFYAYNNTCRKGSYVNSAFTKAVYLTGIEYVTGPSTGGAYPVSITANVVGQYHVGDTLQAKDFTVKVTMSDGSVLVNPANWYATPLKLTSTTNNITVGYQGVTTTIIVNAIGVEPIPVKLQASIINTHQLGDVLSAKDFKIIVTMSDGTIKTNPSNWAASPLQLNPDTNTIKVMYQGLTTNISVKYLAQFN